jgi:60 kDa SS-A/Ro ribonucleoprotein
MANKSLFQSRPGRAIKPTDTTNNAGGTAYALSDKAALAQIAMTGTLHDTFYVGAEMQLASILEAAGKCDPLYVAKTAVYARKRGFMKDMPALLVAHLSTRNAGPVFPAAFRAVIDNGKMLRNFVQIMRSGVTGRKSLGTRPKKLVQGWLENAYDDRIIRAMVGQDPSLADVIKMVHPKAPTKMREALLAYIIGRPYEKGFLPEALLQFERFKRNPNGVTPDVPFQMLTAQPLTKEQWANIGFDAGWHMLRMNLNTFARHDAFKVDGFAEFVAAKIADPNEVKLAKAFPYQIMLAHHMCDPAVPPKVKDALSEAMEYAVSNVPALDCRVAIFPDVSGSMSSPVTGYRKGATTTVTCNDVAALMTAALLRVNREAVVMPFEGQVVSTHRLRINPRDTVFTNARKLASIGGGSTQCSAPLAKMNATDTRADLVVYISDSESWVDSASHGRGLVSWNRGTQTMVEWEKFRQRNPKAKMVCIDLTPNRTTQASGHSDILNVGGFSDVVFDVVANFAKGSLGADHWVKEIEATTF